MHDAAISMTLCVDSTTVPWSFGGSVIKAAAHHLHRCLVKKHQNLALDEASSINVSHGNSSRSLADKMILLVMCIGFCCLLWFSSLTFIVIGGIFWLPLYFDKVGVQQLGSCMIILRVVRPIRLASPQRWHLWT